MGFNIDKQLGFFCLTNILFMPRVWQFFLMLGMIPAVKDDERVRFREGLVLGSLRKRD